MYKFMGGGGLVFQDRYRIDRLAHMKNFSQCRNTKLAVAVGAGEMDGGFQVFK